MPKKDCAIHARRLESRCSYFDAIVDCMPVALFTLDEDKCILKVNKAAEKISGYSQVKILGKFVKEVFPSHSNLGDNKLSKTIITKRKVNIKVNVISSCLIDEAGRNIGFVLIVWK